MSRIATVIVTHNRRALLESCLSAIAAQTYLPDLIFIVDNASTDDTAAWLMTWLPQHLPQALPMILDQNTGGAGGFSRGLRTALESGADWIWMMDDDARPYPNALEELLKSAVNPFDIYGSLAVSGKNTSWPITLLPGNEVVLIAETVPTFTYVTSIPLLGFMIHRSLVDKIGYPDADFFIAADDVEYCVRARHAGAKIAISGNSRIEHPRAQVTDLKLFGRSIFYLSLPPWKRYYDTRNRLLIARKYYGMQLITQTIPGSFVRVIAALIKEPRKPAQLKAFTAGFIDGLLGRKGRRHEKWGIR